MIFDIIGDLLTDRRQLKQLGLDDRIVGLLGKLPLVIVGNSIRLGSGVELGDALGLFAAAMPKSLPQALPASEIDRQPSNQQA
jgi:hypothetical protein